MNEMELRHHIEVRTDDEGHNLVSILVDLDPEQVDAALHALRIVRDHRYRLTEVSTDDALALRDVTSLIDELSEVVGGYGIARFLLTVARLGVLREGLVEFTAGEHLEREGDASAHPVAWDLLRGVESLHAEALHAALTGVVQHG